MDPRLQDAVVNRKVLTFWYDDHRRVVEPHAYGLTWAGVEAVRGYQIGGTSASDDELPWRLFTVRKMRSLHVTDRTFLGPRPRYRKGDRALRVIHAEL